MKKGCLLVYLSSPSERSSSYWENKCVVGHSCSNSTLYKKIIPIWAFRKFQNYKSPNFQFKRLYCILTQYLEYSVHWCKNHKKIPILTILNLYLYVHGFLKWVNYFLVKGSSPIEPLVILTNFLKLKCSRNLLSWNPKDCKTHRCKKHSAAHFWENNSWTILFCIFNS